MEQVSIGPIAGTSSVNRVRITGGPTRVAVEFTNTTTTDRHVIRLSGADYVTLDSLTLNNYGTTYGYGVWLNTDADYNIISNCLINVDSASTSASFAGITFSGSTPTTTGNNGDYNLIQGNEIAGGYYSISQNGTSSSVFSTDNQIINNYCRSFYYYGIRHYMQVNGVIRGNRIQERATGTTAGFGIYAYYNQSVTIEQNWLERMGTYGIYTAYQNYIGSALLTRSSIRNNFIGGTFLAATPYAAYLTTNTYNVDFFHNSTSQTSGNGRGIYVISGGGNDIRNNSFSVTNSASGYALYVSSTSYVTTVNYNNYWVPGSSNFIYIGAAIPQNGYVGTGGYNANSYDGDPNYLNPVNNLHGFGTQLFDRGDPSAGVLTDYDGQTRPNPYSAIPDIGADEFLPDSLDMAIVEILEPNNFYCPDSFQSVSVVMHNRGLNPIAGAPIQVNISGAGTATLNGVYPGPLTAGQRDTFLVGTFNTWPGGTYNIEAFGTLAGDANNSNDTLSDARQISMTPAQPTVSGPSTVCAGDSAQLVAASTGTNFWYDAPMGGNQLAMGDTLNTGPIGGGAQYYVEARGLQTGNLSTTYANNNSCGGGNMFEVFALNEITIDSFASNLSSPGTSTLVDIYYKVGGYTGFETNAGAWTLLGSATVTSAGPGLPTIVPVGGLTIPAGQTYAIYLYSTLVLYTTLSTTTTYSNSDMDITCGVGLCSLFGGTNNPRGWNGTVFYRALGCPSQRTPVAMTVDTPPTLTLNDTTNCGIVTLTGGPSGPSYAWSNGDITNTTTVTTSGPITVTATQGACTVMDSAFITINALPTVNLGGDVLLCDGATVTLDAGNAGSSYDWSTTATTQTITVSTAGTYDVDVTDGNGCVGSDTVNVTVGTSPAGSFTIDDSQCPTITFHATSNGGTVITDGWDFGDGQTGTGLNPSNTYASNGTYTVLFIQENDCGIDTVTNTFTIDCLTGIEDGIISNVSLYPNPTQNSATLQMDLPVSGVASICVMDLAGRTLVCKTPLMTAGTNRIQLDLNSLSAGVYFVKVTAGDLNWQGRLVKE